MVIAFLRRRWFVVLSGSRLSDERSILRFFPTNREILRLRLRMTS